MRDAEMNIRYMKEDAMKRKPLTGVVSALTGLALTISAGTGLAQEQLDRTVLPIAEPKPPTYKRARRAQRQAAGAVRGQGAAKARPTS